MVGPETDLVQEMDHNFVSTWCRMASLVGGEVTTFGAVRVVQTGLEVAFFNPIFVTHPLDDPRADLGAAIDHLRSTGLPFIVHVRGGVEPGAAEVARSAGLTPLAEPLPGMVLEQPRPPDPHPDLDIRPVEDEGALGAFQEVTAESFGMDGSIVRRFFPPSVLGASDVELYLGLYGREPVASSSLIRTDLTAGIYNVGTLGRCRGRGLGTALSWHAIRRGVELGCERAVLQSSPMGRPVYDRMGFREVVRYRSFTGP